MQAPKNRYPHLAAHHVDKSGEVIPTSPKVIHPNTLNCAPIFRLLLRHHIFFGGCQFLDLTFKVPPVSRHVAKFHGSLNIQGLNAKSSCS